MENGKSVSTIIKQLEQHRGSISRKPPVPLGKPSISSKSNPQQQCDTLNSATAAETDNVRRKSNPDVQLSTDFEITVTKESFHDTQSKFTPPDSDNEKFNKKIGPPPPPKPQIRNKSEDTPKGHHWRRLNDRWVPSTSESERSSTNSLSSNECQKGPNSKLCNGTSVPDLIHSIDIKNKNNADLIPKKYSVEEPALKKPDVPNRRRMRKSDGNIEPSSLRVVPSVPVSKPRHVRKFGNTNSTLSNSSVPSMSDDGDSDTEIYKAGCSNAENTGDQNDVNISTPKTPQPQKAFRCAEEFLTTEKSYLKTLEDLSEIFPRFMKEQSVALNRTIVEPDIPEIIATSLQGLREFHRLLAAEFQKRIDNWDSDPRLADLFLNMGHFLKVSIGFLQRKEELATQVLTACKRYPEFQTILTTFERQHFDGLHLVHKLDSVHQRLCRYPLLLNSYLKFLSPDTAEYKEAEAAKNFINGITLDLEKSLAEGDGTRKLSELYRRIVHSDFEVISPGRKLLKEGLILKHSRKEQQSRHLILFTDVLICCTPIVTGNLLRVGHIFWLSDFKTTVSATGDEIADPDNPGWEFQVTGRRKSITFIAKSSTEGGLWFRAIQNAIAYAQRRANESSGRVSIYSGDTAISDCGCSLSITESAPSISCDAIGYSDLGRLAPVWTPDQRVTMCQCCGSAFTLIRRRHHCRACGRVICDDCSGKAPLEYADFKSNRVCPKCYAILYEQTKSQPYMEYLLDKTRITGSQILSLFAAPRNGFRTDGAGQVDKYPGATMGDDSEDEEGSISFSGYLSLSRNGQQWKKYWAVIRDVGLLEFYKAVNDRISETKIILVGWQTKSVDRERLVFELIHMNQFDATPNTNGNNVSSSLHYWLKASDNDSMDRWLSALDSFFEQFAA